MQLVLNLPMVRSPAANLNIVSGGMHLLSGIISQSRARVRSNSREHEIFHPLGVGDVIWPSDPQGVSYGCG